MKFFSKFLYFIYKYIILNKNKIIIKIKIFLYIFINKNLSKFLFFIKNLYFSDKYKINIY